MYPDPASLTLKIHPSTFAKIEQGGGASFLFGEGGVFQEGNKCEKEGLLSFELRKEKRGEMIRLIRALPVSIRSQIIGAGWQILRLVREEEGGGQFTLRQGLRGFEGMELPSCLGLAYHYLKKGHGKDPYFWGEGETAGQLRREFSLLQEDLENDSSNAGRVARNHNQLEDQLSGRIVFPGCEDEGGDFANAWVFELDPNSVGVAFSSCQEAGKFRGGGFPEEENISLIRYPLGNPYFLVVSPVGCGSCQAEDSLRRMKILVGQALLHALKDLSVARDSRYQEYLIQIKSSLTQFESAKKTKGDLMETLAGYLEDEEERDLPADPDHIDQFFEFLSWAEGGSGSPIFLRRGSGSRHSFYGLPAGFVSWLVKMVETQGSGFASHVFDTSYDPDRVAVEYELSGVERVAGAERIISSRFGQDWVELGKIRQKLFEELKAGSPDFLSLVMGEVALEEGSGAEEGMVCSLKKLHKDLGGAPLKTGSLVDFAKFLLGARGPGLAEDLRAELSDALEHVRKDVEKRSGSLDELCEKMKKRGRLCEVVGSVTWALLEMTEKYRDEGKKRKILTKLISQADKTENFYAMWRFGTADIQFGKAMDVLTEGEILSEDGPTMFPLCSWSMGNTPYGDWSTCLLVDGLGLEDGDSDVNFKGLTGVLPTLEGCKELGWRRDARRGRLEALLAVFGVDKDEAIGKESFASLLMDGIGGRLAVAREKEDDDFFSCKTIAALSCPEREFEDLERKLSRLLEMDFDTVKLGALEVRLDISPMIPLLAGLLRARARLGDYGDAMEGYRRVTVVEEIRDWTSSLLVASALICGGIKDEDLTSAVGFGITEWSKKVAGEAKNFGGILGQTREDRSFVCQYVRRHSSLGEVRRLTREVGAFRGDEGLNTKTEVFGAVGYFLSRAMAKIEEGLTEDAKASRRHYSGPVGLDGVQRAIMRCVRGGDYLSRPTTLIQEEVAQYRKLKSREMPSGGDGGTSTHAVTNYTANL